MIETAGTLSASSYRDQVTASVLWAAWADAVGFISELTDEPGLQRRTGGRPLDSTMDWRRRVGGQYGVQAPLPAGTYSDDTQLRLAVGRAISTKGFDVEAFARIELPVWPAYALGGGRASKAAAASMAKANATWHTNFYDGWTKAGGNGAAMRIQPHVWASGSRDDYIVPVLRDAVVTHGHPRALVGAVLHAVSLAFALRQRRTAGVDDWPALLTATRRAMRFFNDDADLATIWVPSWEREEGRSFQAAWEEAVQECAALLEVGAIFVTQLHSKNPDAVPAYQTMVREMGLAEKATKGSGTATVTAAMALAAAFEGRPGRATTLAANMLGTDTDTIATIAAATIAAAAPSDPPGALQDELYLREEARRYADIADQVKTRTFPYPDTLRWKPPQSQLDAVGLADGRTALAGLAWLEPESPTIASRDAAWTWMRSSFGATFLLKHRSELRELPAGNWPSDREVWQESGRPVSPKPPAKLPGIRPLFDDEALMTPTAPSQARVRSSVSLDDVIAQLHRDGISDVTVGRAVRRIAQSGSRDQLALLVGFLANLLRDPDSSNS